MDELSYVVSLWDDMYGHVIWMLLSVFCRSCGHRRGTPRLEVVDVGGDEWALMHQWTNPCGHVDTAQSVRAEVAGQCQIPECTTLASEMFYPFCGETCYDAASPRIGRPALVKWSI